MPSAHADFEIPVFVLKAIVRGAVALGVDVAPALRTVGLTPEMLEERRRRVPASVEEALWRALYARCPDAAAMGALGAVHSPRGAFGVLEYAARTAPTVTRALDLLVAHSALLHGLPIFTLERRPQGLRLHYHLPHDATQSFSAAAAELALGAVVRILGQAAAGDFRPEAVELCHGPGRHDVAELFGVRVRHRQDRYAVAIPLREAELPLEEADPALHGILVDQLDDEAEQRRDDDDFVGRVRREVARRLLSGAPSLTSVAKVFGMAPRTLQARLGSHDTSFRDVIAAARIERAKRYLCATNMSVASVAALAGYSDERSLYRSFRRNLDTTPDALRRTRNDRPSDE